MGWARRYQPVDLGVIAGLGTEQELRHLIRRAHGCGVRVIADVVFNHMADLDGRPEREEPLRFPGLGRGDFNGLPGVTLRRPCRDGDSRVPGRSGYDDGNRDSELGCWLGSLPDLVFTATVKRIQKDHLDRLLRLGIDGFRFDAAKHMPPQVLKEYVDHIDGRSQRRTWNYLEVIEDGDTRAQDYAWIAAVTDFVLYGSLRRAFSWGGDLRSLPAVALADPRSVTFGRTHDNLAEIRVRRQDALDPWSDAADAWLASAYVLARQAGARRRCRRRPLPGRRCPVPPHPCGQGPGRAEREGNHPAADRPEHRAAAAAGGRGIHRDQQGRRPLRSAGA
jgi:alpha-amylase